MKARSFREGTVPWEPILGTRPRGFDNEPELYGEHQGRKTYLDYCDCGNPNCNGLVARFVDDRKLCRQQTLALREEAGLLFEIYVKMRTGLEELKQARLLYEFSIINEPEERDEAFKSHIRAEKYVRIALKRTARMRDLLETTGIIYFYLEQDEQGYVREKYRIEGCPTFALLMDEERLSQPALPSGMEEDDPARKIADELPAKENFFDEDFLNQLFNGRLGADNQPPAEGEST